MSRNGDWGPRSALPTQGAPGAHLGLKSRCSFWYTLIVQEFAFFASVLADGWGESQKETMSGRGPDDGMALAAWTWYNKALQHPNTPDWCGPMYAEVTPGWNVFKQIFTEHWEGFKPFRPRYHTPYYDDLVDKMLRCGNPDQIGYIAYRCLHCGQGKHRVAMSCKSSLCLRCAKVSVDNWQIGRASCRERV